ncbi:Tm-1-like ATP-binding domain-containing protein [Christensenellaceae bacterium OttesenSCG-928-K19]|nr:Tm-1-like ATP-binding domain-containing protein [Christensenellaceae bacterium OttesenSCG-928-K19]
MTNGKPNIICTGMLDTKGPEIKFLAEQVEEQGGNAIIMDMSTGHENDWADIKLSEVLAMTGHKVADVMELSRSDATPIVGKAGAEMVVKLNKEGKCDGIISWAGSMGTTVVTYAMRALPFGVPKIMLNTLASSDVSLWLGNKDIYIANPISEKSVNVITRKAIANAAAAVVAMAKVGDKKGESHPLVALTAYGTTTPAVTRCLNYMENRGWDTMVVHQVGTGATMEDYIRSGEIKAVFEITPGELTNNMYDSIYGTPDTWDGKRFTAASEVGIPQIVAPGGLDQSACGNVKSLPQEYLDDFKSGKRKDYKGTGKPYCHNESVTIMVPTKEETIEVTKYMMDVMNKTNGPTIFMIPMKGWSAYDQSDTHARSGDFGWYEQGDGPVFIHDDDNPEWSKRATTMWKTAEELWNKDNKNFDLIQVDAHILDPAFTDLMSQAMGDILDGKWKPGMYRDNPIVVK